MHKSPADLLRSARLDLQTAVGLSRQGSYQRRTPSPESQPYYGEAKRQLHLLLEVEPEHREALMMMAQIAEGLMDFQTACEYVNKEVQAGEPKTKKLLKKLAQLRENTKQWKGLVLTPDMLLRLGEYLESMGVGPANRSLDFTRKWLSSNFDGDSEQVIKAMDERGAFSDFQVLANVVQG